MEKQVMKEARGIIANQKIWFYIFIFSKNVDLHRSIAFPVAFDWKYLKINWH